MKKIDISDGIFFPLVHFISHEVALLSSDNQIESESFEGGTQHFVSTEGENLKFLSEKNLFEKVSSLLNKKRDHRQQFSFLLTFFLEQFKSEKNP